MAYQKTIWTNGTNPPIDEDNLNNMENGIKNNDTAIGNMAELETTATDLVGAVNEMKEPAGVIKMFAGSVAPTGYLLCDGSEISRTTYSNLFNIIGTTYGIGDESTTFNLPNLKGKVPVGLDSNDTNFNSLSKTGGTPTVTLGIQQIPEHKHDLYISDGSGNLAGLSYVTGGSYNGNFTRVTGGSQPHNNLQPYIVLNYIIKY